MNKHHKKIRYRYIETAQNQNLNLTMFKEAQYHHTDTNSVKVNKFYSQQVSDVKLAHTTNASRRIRTRYTRATGFGGKQLYKNETATL